MPATSTSRQLVVTTRKQRYGSVRKAAAAGGVSNTTWGRYEAGDPLTDTMRLAAAQAFDWPTDWPVNPPTPAEPLEDRTALDLLEQIDRKVDGLDELNRRIEKAVYRALSGIAAVGELPAALDAAGRRATQVEHLMHELLDALGAPPAVPATTVVVPSKRPSKPRKRRSPPPKVDA